MKSKKVGHVVSAFVAIFDVRRVGDGNVEWIKWDGLQSFPHSKQCWSFFYKYCWYDRLEFDGYGLALCKGNFY